MARQNFGEAISFTIARQYDIHEWKIHGYLIFMGFIYLINIHKSYHNTSKYNHSIYA